MVDAVGPLGPLAGPGGIPPRGEAAGRPGDGASFKEVLKKSIDEVNDLQKEADRAIQDLAQGKRDDFAGVITAVEKADVAFKTLMQVRNKLIDAYQEFNRMRV
jgi:flagellar hook-basal body complex protein FliE